MSWRRARTRTLAAGCSALALAGLVLATTATASRIDPSVTARVAARPSASIPVIVTMRADVDGRRRTRPALIRALRRTAARSQAHAVRRLDGPVRRHWLVNAFSTRVDTRELRALRADRTVRSVRLDRAVTVRSPRRGHVAAAGADAGDAWGVAAIGAPAAWEQGITGAGVRVGIIDTGVDPGHPLLAGRVVAWRDFTAGRPEPYDDNGHGTHTVGTMAGREGIGVAPDAQIVVAKAMGANGVGSGSDLIAAAEWMTDPDGDPATADQPAIVNNSWSAGGPNDPWFSELVSRWLELGMLPVFAAGNSGPETGSIGSPASYPDVLAVGAIDRSDAVAGFSARGPVQWRDPAEGATTTRIVVKPDLAAPGIGVLSSVPGGLGTYSGTSMAAPHVSGAAALLVQADPGLRGAALADALRASARDVGPAGVDDQSGYGVVDVAAAIDRSREPLPETHLVYRPRTATRSRTALLGVAVERAHGYRVRVDGGEWGPLQTDPRLRVWMRQGEHVIEVAAERADGALDRTPAVHEMTVDRVRPKVRFTWVRRKSGVQLVARATDSLAGVASTGYRWILPGGGAVRGRRAELRLQPRQGSVRARLANGRTRSRTVSRSLASAGSGRPFVVRLRVRDRAGNVRTVTRRIAPVPARS